MRMERTAANETCVYALDLGLHAVVVPGHWCPCTAGGSWLGSIDLSRAVIQSPFVYGQLYTT